MNVGSTFLSVGVAIGLAALYAVPATTWARLRPTVLAFLPKVRGASADDLSDLMRFHGEIDRATEMLTSRSSVRRAHGAYLLELIRDRLSSPFLLRLLGDPDADVRLGPRCGCSRGRQRWASCNER